MSLRLTVSADKELLHAACLTRVYVEGVLTEEKNGSWTTRRNHIEMADNLMSHSKRSLDRQSFAAVQHASGL